MTKYNLQHCAALNVNGLQIKLYRREVQSKTIVQRLINVNSNEIRCVNLWVCMCVDDRQAESQTRTRCKSNFNT